MHTNGAMSTLVGPAEDQFASTPVSSKQVTTLNASAAQEILQLSADPAKATIATTADGDKQYNCYIQVVAQPEFEYAAEVSAASGDNMF